MSWEIYVISFQNGDKCEFNTVDLHTVFGRGALPHPDWPPRDTDYLYDDGHIRTNVKYLGARSDGFVVDRIFGQTAIARLLEAAMLLNGVICWPGDPPIAVASEATFAHLPSGIVEMNPILTKDPAAFIAAVGFSSKMTKEDWIAAKADYEDWYERHERGYRPG